MRKFWQTLKGLWLGLFLGMKKTEDVFFHQSGADLEGGSTINQNVSEKSVAKALLRGEVTQEVEDLRYRTYAVARESENYTYFSPTLAKKKGINDFKNLKIDESDGREIITVQDNRVEIETVSNALNRLGDSGKYSDKPNEYNILIQRDFVPRQRIENYIKKIVVKKGDDDTSAVLDIYVSKYPNDKVFGSKSFVHEVEKIKSGGRSDIFDIKTISFETNNAYRLNDMIRFEFGKLCIMSINEFDGDYVIKYNSKIIDGGTDMTAQFYSPRMAKKYETKARKELTINFDPEANIRVYKCASCGKEVIYDARALDNLNPSEEETDGSATEYLDYEMSEWEYGKMLCKDCLKKKEMEKYRKVMTKK